MTRRDVIAAGGVVILFVALCAAIGPFHPDRSFVTYRFAENVAGGHGPVYNAGDAPVEGYGNTAWLAVCVLLAAAGLDLPGTAWLGSLLAGVAALLLLWRALRARFGVPVSFAAAAFAALSGPLAVAAMSGEGASLVAMLAVASLVLLDRAGSGVAGWIAAGVAGALLALCGGALAVVFPAALAVRARSLPRRSGWVTAAIVYALGVTAFHAWRIHAFGSLAAPAPGFDAGRASIADLFVSQPHDVAPFGLFYLMVIVAGAFGAAVAEDRVFARLVLVTGATVGAVTLTTRDPLPGLAGSAALVPLLVIPAAAALARAPRAMRSRALDTALAAALLVATLGGAMDLRVFARHLRASHDSTLEPLGRWIAKWRPEGSMLCGSPGAVAYYAGWRAHAVGGPPPPGEPDLVLLDSDGLFVVDMDPAQAAVAASLAGRYRVLGAIRRGWTRDRALIIYLHDRTPKLTDDEVESFPHGTGPIARRFR